MSDSVRPHRRQPTRLPCPRDSPGKNTGVGFHFLLQCMKVKSESEVAQLCPTLSDPRDCSLPGSSVHGIFQARVLERGAIAFSVSTCFQSQVTQNTFYFVIMTQSNQNINTMRIRTQSLLQYTLHILYRTLRTQNVVSITVELH